MRSKSLLGIKNMGILMHKKYKNINLVIILFLGITTSFSVWSEAGNASIKQLMKEGNAAFVSGEYDEAGSKFKEVLEIEPQNYEATLYLGDTYFKIKEWDSAIKWFGRAVEIDPNIEIAYRWWADILMTQGKTKESLTKITEALVAEPYNSKTHNGLKAWIQYAKEKGVKFRIKNPVINAQMSVKGRRLGIDKNFGKNNKIGHEAWFGYGMALTFSRSKSAIENEFKAYQSVIDVAKEQGYTKNTQNLDPSLATLLDIDEKGLLKPYIFFNTKKRAVAEQYATYRNKNRDVLHRYWIEEVIQLQ